MTQTDTDAPFLETRALHKRYGGVHALRGVDLTIRRGRFYHLLGENGCGKSTLIKIISGAQSPSEGRVQIEGVEQPATPDPIAALAAGIETVYQDLSLLPNLSVEENIGLTSQLVASGGRLAVRLRRGEMRALAARAAAEVGLPSDPAFLRTHVDRLPIATRQLISIARAVAAEAGLVIMDEPTTALTRREIAHLIGVIRKLQARGTALLFVTHKLDEAKEIGGTGIVMRDGQFVAELDIETADLAEVGELMTNRRIDQARYRAASPAAAEVARLSVDGLSRAGSYRDISFDLAPGEILGITGLLDSGRNPLALGLAGLAPPDAGQVRLDGRTVDLSDPSTGMDRGIAYVPEDRLEEGLFLDKSITDNIAMTVFDRLRGALGIVSMDRARILAREVADDLKIVAEDVDAPVGSLSGGNQQRVLIGRWLATKPRVLILHGPTVGVDVGSKDTIFRIIQRQAEAGMGVIIVSDDIPELIQNCDRIAVMRDGRIVETFDGARVDAGQLYAAIGGILETAETAP
ncbi:sugar ABC transporter ATP-binding protein [Palleronia sediminis]|uniref:Sugar ABC transporter ATP-binding protein n=1 Tax=Palleronia sediminis TaxID=2547833 RepID=A0A4R6A6J7_9RHOB|nr:sugar ABC transporter ATP-binding protein [Palleronia sediminis]TDL78344.1 sugar ABC transporter ATP-binding protein [Palleronia sediminis]